MAPCGRVASLRAPAAAARPFTAPRQRSQHRCSVVVRAEDEDDFEARLQKMTSPKKGQPKAEGKSKQGQVAEADRQSCAPPGRTAARSRAATRCTAGHWQRADMCGRLQLRAEQTLRSSRRACSLSCNATASARVKAPSTSEPDSYQALFVPIAIGTSSAPEHLPTMRAEFAAKNAAKRKEISYGDETLWREVAPARADLIANLVLGVTLVWLPLTASAVGRCAFVTYRITDKRLTVKTEAPWKSAFLVFLSCAACIHRCHWTRGPLSHLCPRSSLSLRMSLRLQPRTLDLPLYSIRKVMPCE